MQLTKINKYFKKPHFGYRKLMYTFPRQWIHFSYSRNNIDLKWSSIPVKLYRFFFIRGTDPSAGLKTGLSAERLIETRPVKSQGENSIFIGIVCISCLYYNGLSYVDIRCRQHYYSQSEWNVTKAVDMKIPCCEWAIGKCTFYLRWIQTRSCPSCWPGCHHSLPGCHQDLNPHIYHS